MAKSETKSELPRLTEKQIQALASEQSFDRGDRYYRQEAIFNGFRQGMDLRAECQGSSLYHVSARLSPTGVESSSCSCPYDWGGLCKHQVAMLLTYLHQPEMFQVIPPMTDLLASRSREELVDLIDQMIQRQPNLLYLVELSAPHAAGEPGKPIEVSTYRRKAQSALRRDEVDEVMEGLDGLMDAARQLLDRGDWLNAGALYQMLLAEITTAYDGELQSLDYDGDVCGVSQDAVAGLNECLSKAENLDSGIRETWLTTLLEAQFQEFDLGGIDFAAGAGEALLEWATDEEWEVLETRIREQIRKRDRWAKEHLVHLLAQRQRQSGRGNANQLIHELGTPEQRAFLLVEEGTFEQAIAIARTHFSTMPGLITRFADALVAADQADLALSFISQQQERDSYNGYRSWLSNFYRTHGNPQAALDLDYQEFQAHPSFPGYLALRKLAQSLGRWESLQKKVLKHLEQTKQGAILIDIAIEEGDADRAFKLYSKAETWVRSSRAETVAKAIEGSRPQDAIMIYSKLAEQAIDLRNRGAYQVAATHLKQVKALQTPENWRPYIQLIRTRHSNLRALQDELNRAGL